MNNTEDLYENPSANQEILNEARTESEVERIEIHVGKGIKTFLKGEKYPMKGLPTPEALVAVNVAKRSFISFVRLITSPIFLPSLILGMIFYKPFLRRLTSTYLQIVKPVIKPYILKEEYRWSGTNEITKIGEIFLKTLGLDHGISVKLAHIFEYDAAYRFRLIDIMQETNQEALINRPIREIRRLVKIEQVRDYQEVGNKFGTVGLFLQITLLHPAVRRAFKAAITQADILKLRYDEEDIYWALKRTDYNAFGLSFDERQLKLKETT